MNNICEIQYDTLDTVDTPSFLRILRLPHQNGSHNLNALSRTADTHQVAVAASERPERLISVKKGGHSEHHTANNSENPENPFRPACLTHYLFIYLLYHAGYPVLLDLNMVGIFINCCTLLSRTLRNLNDVELFDDATCGISCDLCKYKGKQWKKSNA